MSTFKCNGDANLAEARKYIKKSQSIWAYFSHLENQDQALKYYRSSVNNYKIEKNITKAIEVDIELYQYLLHIESDFNDVSIDIRDVLEDIAKLYISVGNNSNAIEYYQILIKDASNIIKVAKYYSKIGDISDTFEQRIDSYSKAIEIYSCECDHNTDIRILTERIAEIYLNEMNDFTNAIQYYLKVIECFQNLPNASQSKYMLTKYYFLTALLYLSDNTTDAQIYTDRIVNFDPHFSGRQEYKVLLELIDAVENSNTDKLTEVLIDYDDIYKMTKEMVAVCLKIKRNISNQNIEL